MTCRKRIRRCQNRGVAIPLGSAWGMHWDCPSGIRHGGGAKLNQALVWNVRTWPAMPREKAQAAPTVRLKVPMRRRGADCLVVATKWGNAHGAKGGASSLSAGQLDQTGRSLQFQRKAAAFVRWHEPDDARVSRPESVRGSG